MGKIGRLIFVTLIALIIDLNTGRLDYCNAGHEPPFARTPLVTGEWGGSPVHYKLDFMMPTGSFKDRGMTVMVSYLRSRGIARVLGDSEDHPDVETLHQRASAIDSNISIATVYRTVRLFEEAGILERHEFGDGRSRYEAASESHHDHLIDVETGRVIEFVDPELEQLQKAIAEKLGFRLVDHRLQAARRRAVAGVWA